jgi:large subunit ribosomal protein L1
MTDGILGTVTDDVAHTVRMSKSLFDFRADKHGVLHTGLFSTVEREQHGLIYKIGIGKVNFQSSDLEANLKVILEELRTFGKANNLKGK